MEARSQEERKFIFGKLENLSFFVFNLHVRDVFVMSKIVCRLDEC